ncbi:hypothetical protein C2R22_12185 [Salinigranum rubrum]|uniref:CARDB domain-containing protein n=1 Tax=Salinigranum rubrum TaxID=755307 RepID=A0A2I8VK55_9EURY|nr:hypothetical protein [Salinigranum rubrum]AUV82307.1 hypothetical protein C2R22_12185 [Salinigranum rubrum]
MSSLPFPSTLSRRHLLAAVAGSLAAVAGCTTRTPQSTSEPTARPPQSTSASTSPTPTPESPERSPTDSSTTVRRVTLDDAVVRKAVRYESVMGSGGVLAGEDEQYVVATVRAPRNLQPSSFSFEANGRSWSPGLPETAGAVNVAVAGLEGWPLGRNDFDAGRPALLAFTVPSPLSASNPRIRFDGGASGEAREWPLPAGERERLAAPAARFELDSLSVPESVSQGEPLSVSLSVTNVSNTAGRFLAALYWPTKLIADDDESHVLEREADAGETVTLSTDIDTAYTTNEAESIPLKLRGHVSAEREVRVENAGTPS